MKMEIQTCQKTSTICAGDTVFPFSTHLNLMRQSLFLSMRADIEY
jgi:hypothetical protein